METNEFPNDNILLHVIIGIVYSRESIFCCSYNGWLMLAAVSNLDRLYGIHLLAENPPMDQFQQHENGVPVWGWKCEYSEWVSESVPIDDVER